MIFSSRDVWLVGGGGRLRGSGSAEVGDGLQTLVKLFRCGNVQERRISRSLNVGVGGDGGWVMSCLRAGDAREGVCVYHLELQKEP
jgi:hypothetical protein